MYLVLLHITNRLQIMIFLQEIGLDVSYIIFLSVSQCCGNTMPDLSNLSHFPGDKQEVLGQGLHSSS